MRLKQGGSGIDLTNYECKKRKKKKKSITWRDLGLSPIYMLLDLCCKKRHSDPTKLRPLKKKERRKPEGGGKKAEEAEMGHVISRDKACLKATRKPLKYLTGELRGEARGSWPGF